MMQDRSQITRSLYFVSQEDDGMCVNYPTKNGDQQYLGPSGSKETDFTLGVG